MEFALAVVVVALLVVGAAAAVAVKRVWARAQNRIAFLEARVDALENSQERFNRFLRNNSAYIGELWNSYETLYAILHPNRMEDSYTV